MTLIERMSSYAVGAFFRVLVTFSFFGGREQSKLALLCKSLYALEW